MTRQEELRALARMATMSAYTPSVRRSAKASLDSKAPKLATDLADALDQIARLKAGLQRRGQYFCERCEEVVWGGDHTCPGNRAALQEKPHG